MTHNCLYINAIFRGAPVTYVRELNSLRNISCGSIQLILDGNLINEADIIDKKGYDSIDGIIIKIKVDLFELLNNKISLHD
jgi:hypothetical protein